MSKLTIISAKDLLEKKYTIEMGIVGELRAAANALENGYYEGAAWRLADACGDFVGYVQKKGKGIDGIDIPTGKGVQLDKIMTVTTE